MRMTITAIVTMITTMRTTMVINTSATLTRLAASMATRMSPLGTWF